MEGKNGAPVYDESVIRMKVRSGMYKFCYRGEWVIIMKCGPRAWQAFDKNGGFANCDSMFGCEVLAKDEIKKVPATEDEKQYGWWENDPMFKDLI